MQNSIILKSNFERKKSKELDEERMKQSGLLRSIEEIISRILLIFTFFTVILFNKEKDLRYRLLFIFTLFICPFFAQAQDVLSKLEKEYNNASNQTMEQLNLAPKYATALFFHNVKSNPIRF
jgi:hypothetical protein